MSHVEIEAPNSWPNRTASKAHNWTRESISIFCSVARAGKIYLMNVWWWKGKNRSQKIYGCRYFMLCGGHWQQLRKSFGKRKAHDFRIRVKTHLVALWRYCAENKFRCQTTWAFGRPGRQSESDAWAKWLYQKEWNSQPAHWGSEIELGGQGGYPQEGHSVFISKIRACYIVLYSAT